MVEVFKTNVIIASQADNIICLLLQHFPNSKINFDLENCDNILRVEGDGICFEKIKELVLGTGYRCEVLE